MVSQEVLTAHPLLSPTPSASGELLSAAQQSQLGTTPSTPPRYVPYTPRQRTVPTTSTTVSPSIAVSTGPSKQPFGGATSKLQLQSLKAAVQTMGVDNESVGWTILEKFVGGEVEGADWDEIWGIIAGGQVRIRWLRPLMFVHVFLTCITVATPLGDAAASDGESF